MLWAGSVNECEPEPGCPYADVLFTVRARYRWWAWIKAKLRYGGSIKIWKVER
jgi:hypothetical protein